MACHRHGLPEKTMADILTREQYVAQMEAIDATLIRIRAEIEQERCLCPDLQVRIFGNYCQRCLTLLRMPRPYTRYGDGQIAAFQIPYYSDGTPRTARAEYERRERENESSQTS